METVSAAWHGLKQIIWTEVLNVFFWSVNNVNIAKVSVTRETKIYIYI